MAETNSLSQLLEETLDRVRDVLANELRDVRDELGQVLGELLQGGVSIAVGGTLAAAGLSTMGLIALVEPAQDRARVGYALSAAALATGAALVGWGVQKLPAAPVQELQERLAEDLQKGLPH